MQNDVLDVLTSRISSERHDGSPLTGQENGWRTGVENIFRARSTPTSSLSSAYLSMVEHMQDKE
jgi:hypothetical protein